MAAQPDFNFKINPNDYLGTDHERFKTTMLQTALANPTRYFAVRRAVLANVKNAAVQAQYDIYYYLLTNGSIEGDHARPGSITRGYNPGSPNDIIQNFIPNIPKQKVNEFALKAAKTIDAIAEEAIEMILPMDYKKISEDRQIQQTAGNLGFGGVP
jgi:hypothetical protein